MKHFSIILLIFVVGVAALSALSESFIHEVLQDPVFSEPPVVVDGASLKKQAPYFELFDLEGKKVKSSDFMGTPTVLTFWTTWNPSATDQIKILDDYARKDSEKLFNIVTISSQEDTSAVTAFIRRGGYEVEVLLDESGAITKMYRARNLPVTYFIDKKGVLSEVFVGILTEKQLVEKVERLLVE